MPLVFIWDIHWWERNNKGKNTEEQKYACKDSWPSKDGSAGNHLDQQKNTNDSTVYCQSETGIEIHMRGDKGWENEGQADLLLLPGRRPACE